MTEPSSSESALIGPTTQLNAMRTPHPIAAAPDAASGVALLWPEFDGFGLEINQELFAEDEKDQSLGV